MAPAGRERQCGFSRDERRRCACVRVAGRRLRGRRFACEQLPRNANFRLPRARICGAAHVMILCWQRKATVCGGGGEVAVTTSFEAALVLIVRGRRLRFSPCSLHTCGGAARAL